MDKNSKNKNKFRKSKQVYESIIQQAAARVGLESSFEIKVRSCAIAHVQYHGQSAREEFQTFPCTRELVPVDFVLHVVISTCQCVFTRSRRAQIPLICGNELSHALCTFYFNPVDSIINVILRFDIQKWFISITLLLKTNVHLNAIPIFEFEYFIFPIWISRQKLRIKN